MGISSFIEGSTVTLAGDESYDTDVFVVGTGPMGSTTALLLATYGVRVTAISNYRWLANSPRAHITNQRAAEVFRDAQIEDELRDLAMPWDHMSNTNIVTSLGGQELARISSWGGGERREDYKAASPTEPMDLPQTFLEPVLVNNAASRGAKILFNTLYLRHEEDLEGVTVYLRDRNSGLEYSQRARYLVGADGGNSSVAENANIEFHGVRNKSGTVYTRFEADLSDLVAHRPGVLTLVLNSDLGGGDTGTGVIRCVRPWNEWIVGWGFDPQQGEPDVSSEKAIEKVHQLIGRNDIEVKLIGTSVWYVNEQYAKTMQSGRVFIGGDAAHRHPPNNGLGSNTCVQDAFNLAWKLAYVVKGQAGEQLLDSYQEERQPIAQQIVERANRSRTEFSELKSMFSDTDRPFDEIVSELSAPTSEGAALRAKFSVAVAKKRYEYQAHGVELNQRYSSTAVLNDGSEPEVFFRDCELYAQVTTRPGAKLPHAWVTDGENNLISTLDLVGQGKFTVVTGPSGVGWVEAVEALDKPWLDVVVIGSTEIRDPYGAWANLREIPEDGALLVRPDGYVAARFEGRGLTGSQQASTELDEAFEQILSAKSKVASA